MSNFSDITVSSSEEAGLPSGESGSSSNSEALSVSQAVSSSTSGCVVLLRIWVAMSFGDCILCGAKGVKGKVSAQVSQGSVMRRKLGGLAGIFLTYRLLGSLYSLIGRLHWLISSVSSFTGSRVVRALMHFCALFVFTNPLNAENAD